MKKRTHAQVYICTYIHAHLRAHTYIYIQFHTLCAGDRSHFFMFASSNISSVLAVCISCRFRVVTNFWIYLHHKDTQHNMHPLPPKFHFPNRSSLCVSLNRLEAPAKRICMYLKNMSYRIPFF